jgi:hypothetical protein
LTRQSVIIDIPKIDYFGLVVIDEIQRSVKGDAAEQGSG